VIRLGFHTTIPWLKNIVWKGDVQKGCQMEMTSRFEAMQTTQPAHLIACKPESHLLAILRIRLIGVAFFPVSVNVANLIGVN
jgi:hypothetical protein